MKVLLKGNERTQNNGACKIVEIDKYLIINGLIYERKNLKPTNRYCVTPTGDSRDSNSAMPSLNQVAILTTPTLGQGFRDNTIYGTELVDSENPNIFYKVFPAYYNGDKRIVKYRKVTESEIEILTETTYTGDYHTIHRFIGQSKDYIYTVWNRTYDSAGSGMNYICKIDKKTLSPENNHFAREKPYPILETETRMYVVTDSADNDYSVGYISKDTGVWTRVGICYTAGASGSSTWCRQRNATGYQINSHSFNYFFAIDGEGSINPRKNTPCIYKGVVDMAKDTVLFKEQTINFDKCSKPISDLYKIIDVSSWSRYTNLKSFDLCGKRYLTMSHTSDLSNDDNGELTKATSWLYLFEIEEETNTIYCLDAVQTAGVFQTVLYGENGRYVCFANWNQVSVFSLDENTMTFKNSFNKYFKDEQLQYFGIDKDNTMWLQSQWQAIYMERIPYNYELFAEYDKSTIKFAEGESEKLVNLKIGYRDYYKNYKTKKVKITLDHPNNQIFTSNDSHIIIVDTLTNGLLSIPVKVYKSGYLKFDVEFV